MFNWFLSGWCEVLNGTEINAEKSHMYFVRKYNLVLDPVWDVTSVVKRSSNENEEHTEWGAPKRNHSALAKKLNK